MSRQKVRFGETPLQWTPATAGKLSDGQAFKPAREAHALPKFNRCKSTRRSS